MVHVVFFLTVIKHHLAVHSFIFKRFVEWSKKIVLVLVTFLVLVRDTVASMLRETILVIIEMTTYLSAK